MERSAVLFLPLVSICLLTHCATDDLAGLTTRNVSAREPSAVLSGEAGADVKSQTTTASEAANQAASATEVSRSLASTDGKLEQSFTKLMNSPQASDYIHQELSRVQVLHFLSDAYLKSFDELLTTAVKSPVAPEPRRFLENEPYAQLLATRRLLDETETRLNYFLYRALETKWSEDVRPDHKQSAVQLVEHFKYNLERRSEAFHQAAMQEIANGFSQASEQARASYLSQYTGQPPAGLARDLGLVLKAIADRKVEPGAMIRSDVTKAKSAKPLSAEMTSQVSKDIANLVKEIQANWRAEAEARVAATGKVTPSTGGDGSLDGTNFKNSTWALTFDDGPSPHDTKILHALESHHMRATFFWVAQNVLDQKDQVKTAQALGMNLANHSFTNFDLARSDATPERIQHEVADAALVEAGAYGYRPTLFRCPFGSCLQVDSVREALEAQKFVHVQWNVDGLDWKDHQADSVYARIKKQMELQKHGIIVLRDTYLESSVVAARLMQDFSQDKSVRLVTIQEAIDETNKK